MIGEVSAVKHDVLDDAVEARALVVQLLAGRLAYACLARAERPEVLAGLRSRSPEELELDTTGI